MFSTIVAWIIFVGSSLLLLLAAYGEWWYHFGQSKASRDMHEAMLGLQGLRRTTAWGRIGIFFVAWVASGVYLFG